jgi:hypothetical protein
VRSTLPRNATIITTTTIGRRLTNNNNNNNIGIDITTQTKKTNPKCPSDVKRVEDDNNSNTSVKNIC